MFTGHGASSNPRPKHYNGSMAAQLDFTSQDYLRNPAASIDRLRASGAIVEVRLPIIGRIWITTTQALADRVLNSPLTKSLLSEQPTTYCGRCYVRPQFVVGSRVTQHFVNRLLRTAKPSPCARTAASPG
jgi:hypothetical protein